ncbi:hypothetical protein O181_082985 [Austropuccinia psidii MF-1]|uniref:pH-response transcription factor pacC/RIM101 n=1 Tax=Austropuccinia psidii MF-1 TaxID=1389203 RepID=A0A9Q3FM96_9BASI|nr:hypothetical protein [Austropuccinia psidii MF-1]
MSQLQPGHIANSTYSGTQNDSLSLHLAYDDNFPWSLENLTQLQNDLSPLDSALESLSSSRCNSQDTTLNLSQVFTPSAPDSNPSQSCPLWENSQPARAPSSNQNSNHFEFTHQPALLWGGLPSRFDPQSTLWPHQSSLETPSNHTHLDPLKDYSINLNPFFHSPRHSNNPRDEAFLALLAHNPNLAPFQHQHPRANDENIQLQLGQPVPSAFACPIFLSNHSHPSTQSFPSLSTQNLSHSNYKNFQNSPHHNPHSKPPFPHSGSFSSDKLITETSLSHHQAPWNSLSEPDNLSRPSTPSNLPAWTKHPSASIAHQPSASSGFLGYPAISTKLHTPQRSHRHSSFIPKGDILSEFKPNIQKSSPSHISHRHSHTSSSNTLSSFSASSPPILENKTIRSNSLGLTHSNKPSGLLSPISEAQLKAVRKRSQASQDSLISNDIQPNPHSNQKDKPKRKRMHKCAVCGKDFNRPSALLLHSSVHTGERSNFCKVCGKSFSNLSNLRRHQRQLHVLESEIPLPIIPGPLMSFSPYRFNPQSHF